MRSLENPFLSCQPIKIHLLFASMLVVLLGSACVKESEELDAALLQGESLNTANFFEPHVENFKSLSSPAVCGKEQLMVISALRSLRRFLPKDQRGNSLAFRLSSLGQDACRGDKASKTVSLVNAFIGQPISKVGLILSSKESDYFLHGFEVGLNKEASLGKNVIAKFGVVSAGEGMKALAELVFIDNVAFVVGGMSLDVAKILVAKVPSLKLPLIILNKEPQLLPQKTAIFRIYPNDFDLAQKLALLTQKKGFKRVSILRPDSGKSDIFIDSYKKALNESQVKITHTQTYGPGDFESMDQCVQKIVTSLGLKIEPLLQNHNSKDNPSEAPEKEEQPILTDAAILIPDNFKVIRYFAKLFSYYNAKGVSFLGNQEWRSKDLIEPWDSFLSSSFFVDYVGRYSDLPNGFKLGQKVDPYLVSNEHAASVDAQLIGWRVATIVRSSLKKKGLRKDNMAKYLMALFSKGTERDKVSVFYPDRTLRWRAYGFQIRARQIMIL